MSGGVAIVTGAGSGVGKAVAHGLLANGWRVVFCGRHIDRLNQSISGSGVDHVRTFAQECDVSKAADVKRLFEATIDVFGRVDLLFNNAGSSYPYAMIDEVPIDAWEQVLAVNLTGAFLCAREAFHIMRNQSPQGGRIINNGSVSAYAPRPGSAPYTITKHGITGLTKSLALDGRPFSIASGQIDIGNASTDMTKRMSEGIRQPDGQIRPEPVIEARNVADAVVYMAGLPLGANVLSMVVMATNMPMVGRG
ncbi:SDR family oxidoreductase [Mesorhizobium sp. WSM4887]|uniref:SDR family oxidoreductase n=1 Tax=Mesorhizobium sp. WSM4887 TaxID=3038543 RepID=UPI00241638A7|nr:SDR family oxidoreductase [Mesorhizobium sp. WSM4887]MDG4886825.1 SDR family NAD(P)-dependent oxidoreductase [Mesorhizobium sp. WSM4887]